MAESDPQPETASGYHTIDPEEADELAEAAQEHNFEELADQLKVFSNPNRLRILIHLRERDLCVHDLSALLDLSQSAVSHQLKELRNRGILDRRKEGRVVYYSLSEDGLEAVRRVINDFLD
jgi:DNA-binding transcriptional ArsR family regulator